MKCYVNHNKLLFIPHNVLLKDENVKALLTYWQNIKVTNY